MTNCACGQPLTNNWITAATHNGRCCNECPNCNGACQPPALNTATYIQDVLDRFERREELARGHKRARRRHA